MPLSEDDERILRQIEEQLQRDPSFAREFEPEVSSARRSLFVTVVGTVFAVALTVLLLSVSPYLAFAAFLVAMLCVARAERHVRAIGEDAVRQMAAMRRNIPGAGRNRPS
jgi:hypothetical protein